MSNGKSIRTKQNARLNKSTAYLPATGAKETAVISRANGVDKYRDPKGEGSNSDICLASFKWWPVFRDLPLLCNSN